MKKLFKMDGFDIVMLIVFIVCQIALIVMRAMEFITCSWWLVFIPTYVIVATIIIAIILFFIAIFSPRD